MAAFCAAFSCIVDLTMHEIDRSSNLSDFQQFVWSEFSDEYRPTERRETFYPSVLLADRLYELKITDLPTIPYFPVSSHLEWTDFRYYGLRSATAYVLVFDLSNQDTFQVRIPAGIFPAGESNAAKLRKLHAPKPESGAFLAVRRRKSGPEKLGGHG